MDGRAGSASRISKSTTCGQAGYYYFATCAGGLERFVLEEARRRWSALPQSGQSVQQGRVYFQTNEPIDAGSCAPGQPLFAAAERLFVHLVCASPLELPAVRTNTCAAVEELDKAVTAAVRAVPSEDWRRAAALQAQLTPGDHRNTPALSGEAAPTSLQYRVRVKAPGRGFRGVGAPELSAAFGRAIADHVCGWRLASTVGDSTQIYVQCYEKQLLVGLSASGPSLSIRPDVPHQGLRSTVAWAAARVALGEPAGTADSGVDVSVSVADPLQQYKPLLVCDPLCGRGSLVVEVLRDWPGVEVLAGDAALGTDSSGLLRSELRRNMQASTFCSWLGVGLLVQDARSLPYRNGSVDVLLTDPPFGKKHSDVRAVRALYPQMLAEMRRVVVENGVLCLLCPNSHWDFFRELVLPQNPPGAEKQHESFGRNLAIWRSCESDLPRCWQLDVHYPVRLGPLAVHLCRLLPTAIATSASVAVPKSQIELHSVHSCVRSVAASESNLQVTVAGHQYTKRTLHARCRRVTKSAQALDMNSGDAAVISGPDGEFLRSLFFELQKVRRSSQLPNETKKQQRMSAIDAHQADVFYGTNPQAPHTKCFLIGSQSTPCEAAGDSQSSAATLIDRVAGEARVRNKALIVGAKAAGLEPMSLKRAVDEIYGIENASKKRKRFE
eukprot:COSAG02_NODE_2296_length_9197_cov_11.568587_11_plen_667_part_00